MGGQRHAPAALPPVERDPAPIVQEAGCAPGPVWTGAENLLADVIWNKSISVLKYRLDKLYPFKA